VSVHLEGVVVRSTFGGDGSDASATFERDGDGPFFGERSGERRTMLRAHRFGGGEARFMGYDPCLVPSDDGRERGEVRFTLYEVRGAKRPGEGRDAGRVSLLRRRSKIARGRCDLRALDLGRTLGVAEPEGSALHVVFAHLEQRREGAVFVPIHPTQHSQLAPHGNPGTLGPQTCVRAGRIARRMGSARASTKKRRFGHEHEAGTFPPGEFSVS
jgi:hypothetical protein